MSIKYRRSFRDREQVNHTDDWLMTYADMITLLLCFFAIFLSVSISHAVPKAEPAKETVQPVPPPPPPPQIVQRDDALRGDMPFYGPEHSEQTAADEPDADKPADPPKAEFPEVKNDNTAPPALVEVQVPPPPAPALETAVPAAKPASLPEIADHLKAQGGAEIEQKGDRLTTFSISSATFFGSGSAELSAGGRNILRDVAVNIKSDAFKDYQVTVEGHTDDTPIRTVQFPSNWELSTARASAVVHYFIDMGIPAQRLRAAGYADTFPRVPNRDAGGNALPANQAQNRRVVIKLEKIDKGN